MRLPSWPTLTTFSFSSNLLGYVATPVTVLLVIALAHTLAQLTWSLWPGPSSPPPPIRQSTTRPAAAKGPDIGAILQINLFGKAEATRPVAVVPTAPVAAPETPLKLNLRGIIAASPPDGGAIIAEPGGSDRFFRVGDAITGGAVLQEVKPTQVIMLRNNRLETLHLPKESKGVNNAIPKLPTNNAVAAPNNVDTESNNTEPDAEPDEEESNDNSEEKEENDANQSLNYYRDQLFENPSSLMNLVQTQPVYQAGRLQGFRLHPGQKASGLFKRYGLQANDLVTSLNGIPLDNPMKAFEVLRDLRNASTLEVGVSRQGRNQNITLHFNR